MKWHTGPPAETMSWVLLREGALGQPLPPAAYVPQLNLKPHGGPQAFGLTSLASFALNVAVETGGPVRHECPLDPPPHVLEQLRRCRGFAVSLTTKVLPALLVPGELPAAFTDPEVITGWAELNLPPRRHRWPLLHRTQPAETAGGTDR